MKLAIVSDLHLEFDRDGGAAFLAQLDIDNADVLVVAGDTCVPKMLPSVLPKLATKAPEVVLLVGNHDVYGSTGPIMAESFRIWARDLPNLHVLYRDVWEHQGYRFAGCTLWADPGAAPGGHVGGMDLHRMVNPLDWMPQEHAADMAFLRAESERADVLVTHFIPHIYGVAPRWVGQLGNWYFHVPADEVIEGSVADTVVHGHTHDFHQCRIPRAAPHRAIQMLCNPRGYPSEDQRASYSPLLYTPPRKTL